MATLKIKFASTYIYIVVKSKHLGHFVIWSHLVTLENKFASTYIYIVMGKSKHLGHFAIWLHLVTPGHT